MSTITERFQKYVKMLKELNLSIGETFKLSKDSRIPKYDNVIFHELVHAINYQIYGSQYEWITEGIATYLDGTYKKGKKWLIENYISKYPIPSIYELEHEFGHHEYDSYDYAYLMISYLIETLGKTKFLQVIKNINEVNGIKNNLIIDAINYYKEKE